jgi:ribosomal protein S27E
VPIWCGLSDWYQDLSAFAFPFSHELSGRFRRPALKERRMLSHSSCSRVYDCPRCLTHITVHETNESSVTCPACGTTRIISHKYFTLVACLVVIASYACSFLVVDLLTNDIRRFMLPTLECAFVLLVLSACLLFPRLSLRAKPSATPKRIRRHFWHGFLVPRH